MSLYRTAWTSTAYLLGGVGAVIGLLTIHTPEVAGVVGVGAVVGCLACLTARPGRSRGAEARRVITAGAVTAATGLALTGLIRILGPGAIVTAVIMMVASPPALHRYAATARRCAQWRAPGNELPATTNDGDGPEQPCSPFLSAPVVSVRALSNQELCLAWRTSYTALQRIQRSGEITQQAGLVAARQAYLDELERRDPSGFARWLSAGARPASNPGRYVDTPADPSSE